MNKDKVYLGGYVVGHTADTLGYRGLQIQLENLDIVEIDKNLVHKSINEPQKVTVPQFVADWIEYTKFEDYHLLGAMDSIAISRRKNLDEWFRGDDDNMELFARAWLDGFEIEKEKRYLVKIKGVSGEARYLNSEVNGDWYINSKQETRFFKVLHTRKELEQAGFGWVFDSPGMEVKEVKE